MEELRIVLKNADKINPESIDDALQAGAYKGLEKARTMDKKALIDEVKKSNLRGRGGAGFNAGLKWSFVAPGEEKYIVCNFDEGEPGTYKDRIIVQKDPQRLFEGMAICGYAVESKQGYIYCRGEYPYVVEFLNKALDQAREKGILGKDFDIEVRMGAGAYVCGEESALIESIEGKRGMPRFKPPFPGVEGLWNKPTVVNNVETYANLPEIVLKGAEWFAGIGAPNYPGTKVLTLTGDINNKIFFEVPTNATLRDVIFGFGGGIPGGKKMKAVQVGGTSGGFVPESLIDTKIDFDSMAKINAALGTGAVFVMDETRDIVDIVTRISKFFEHESCGKCNPCREGTFRAYQILKSINEGTGEPTDIDNLMVLNRVMQKSCLCGLGQAAPSPIITTLDHFRNEFDAKMKASTC